MNPHGNKIWRVYFHSSEQMREIRDGSAKIAVASPPFTNHPDNKTLDKREYIDFIGRVFSEVYRVLEPGGILVTINTDLRDHSRYNRGDRRFNGLVWHKHSDLRQSAENKGFFCFDTKVWAKSLKRNLYRYTFAYIQFFKKPGPCIKRNFNSKTSVEFGPDVWLLEKGTDRRSADGFVFRDAIHPEIVKRCLDHFTSPGDLVISPFTGSGTVLAVARIMKRHTVGYEINRGLKSLIQASVETPELWDIYQVTMR